MNAYRVIDELCNIVNKLSDLVKRQQEQLEMNGYDISDFSDDRNLIETNMDLSEYHIRHL